MARLSGASSTISTTPGSVLRVSTFIFGLLEGSVEFIQAETLEQPAHFGDERCGVRAVFEDRVELFVQAPHIADRAEFGERGEVIGAWQHAGRWWRDEGFGTPQPLQAEMLLQAPEQFRGAHRLGQVVVAC